MLVFSKLSKYTNKSVLNEKKEVLLTQLRVNYINGIAQGFMRQNYTYQYCIYYYKNKRTIIYKYNYGKMNYMSVGGIKLSNQGNFITLPNQSIHKFDEAIIEKVNALCQRIKLINWSYRENSSSIFDIITNEGYQDRLLMANTYITNRILNS